MIKITYLAKNLPNSSFDTKIPIEKIVIEVTNKNDNGRVINIANEVERLKTAL